MFDFLSKRFGSLFNQLNSKKCSEDNLKETFGQIIDALVEADVPHDLAEQFVTEIQREVIGQKIIQALKPGQLFIKIVHDRLKQFLGGPEAPVQYKDRSKTLMMGLQGSGKTTTVAKLAHMIKQHNSKKILVGSVDFYRPAAIDQLELLAQKGAIDFYRSPSTDPIEAARDIYHRYTTMHYDHLILDTAGRLHIDSTMLDELRTIKQLLEPTQTILVLDAMTGQESLNVARAFDQAVGFDYALLTKMDSDTRGGAAFSFRYALKKPILFIGTGEKIDDLEEFKPERIAGRILDMGDVVTLAERAEKQIKKEEQGSMYDAMMKGNFTLEDFAKQLEMVNKMGSVSSLMKYLPGMGGLNMSPDTLQKGEMELKRFKAVLDSMTKKERKNPHLLDKSRKSRIAQGAGVQVADINLLLSRFEQSKQYVKLFSNLGRGRGFLR